MLVLAQLVVSTAMVLVTVVMHLVGLAALLWLIRRRAGDSDPPALRREVFGILAAAVGLFVLHGLEIWSYAGLYWMSGAIPSFETALYFSTATYTTIGYGDVLLSPTWRLVGAIEGANGIILLGWSTAFFVAMVARIRLVESVLKSER